MAGSPQSPSPSQAEQESPYTTGSLGSLPLPPLPIHPQCFSQFLTVSYALAPSHSNLFFFSFPSPMGFC